MSEDQHVDKTQSIPADSDPRVLADRHQRRVSESLPESIGPYKVLAVLGEGGMGVVYLAEQEKPIHRRVALKVIKLGMDTKQVLARFETEREALALMNHPNVARVLDAGTTPEGRPYFAMEHVPGIPITDYCDKHHLTTEERLHLFMDVCHAVQHAHQKGIIHRDIKPSNVLVSVDEADPSASPLDKGGHRGVQVKVIDFGVAKATEQRLSELTFSTQEGQFIGTPAYMSPEQAGGSPHDIDTRTDVYSLGVLLYELLVGVRPFDDEMLRSAALSEIQRIIREVEPPKPSTRLSSIGMLSTTIADNRATETRTLAKKLRGDLDWIVMKCLEKDRTRRYETANGLALELQRFLNNEPVIAGPPSAIYRIKKFVRRNKGPVAAVGVVIALLAGGLAGTSYGLLQAVRAREAEAEQRENAEEARDEAEAVTQYLVDTLAAADPWKQGKDITVREVLDSTAPLIDEQFDGHPAVQARVHHAVGWTYRSLGLLDEAQSHLTDAAALYHLYEGRNDPKTLRATNDLASVLLEQGALTDAKVQMIVTLEALCRELGDEHPDTLGSMNNLAGIYLEQGLYQKGEQLLRKILALQQQSPDDNLVATFITKNNLAYLYTEQGRYAEAEALHLETLNFRMRTQGGEHPDTLSSMNNLAIVYKAQGRFIDAQPLLKKALEIQDRILGSEHRATLITMNNLAIVYKDQGRYAEAEPLYMNTLKIRKSVLGSEHPETLHSIVNLAGLYAAQKRFGEAERSYRQGLEAMDRVLGKDHPSTLKTTMNLANMYGEQGRYDEAEPLYLDTIERQDRSLGSEHPDRLFAMTNLARLYEKQGRVEEAESLFLEMLVKKRRVLGEEHPDTLASMNNLARLYFEQNRYDEAERFSAEAVAGARKRLAPEHPKRASYESLHGIILLKLGRLDEAQEQLLESYPILSAVAAKQDDAKETVTALFELYEARDAAEPGKGYDAKAAEWRAKVEEMSKNPNVETSKP